MISADIAAEGPTSAHSNAGFEGLKMTQPESDSFQTVGHEGPVQKQSSVPDEQSGSGPAGLHEEPEQGDNLLDSDLFAGLIMKTD